MRYASLLWDYGRKKKGPVQRARLKKGSAHIRGDVWKSSLVFQF